jgi:hypothetical protein
MTGSGSCVVSHRAGRARAADGRAQGADVAATVAKLVRTPDAARVLQWVVTTADWHGARRRRRAPEAARLGALDSPRWCGPEGGDAAGQRSSEQRSGGDLWRQLRHERRQCDTEGKA